MDWRSSPAVVCGDATGTNRQTCSDAVPEMSSVRGIDSAFMKPTSIPRAFDTSN
jgi:hypothetical protein